MMEAFVVPPPANGIEFIQIRSKKRPFSFYVTHVIGPQHILPSLCFLPKIDVLNVKIQSFQAFLYYPMHHSSGTTTRERE